MSRGFFKGFGFGGGLAMVAAAVASVLSYDPVAQIDPTPPNISSELAPTASERELQELETPQIGSIADVQPQVRPQMDGVDSPPDMDAVTQALDRQIEKPQIGAARSSLDAMPQEAEAMAPEVEQQSPVLPSPQANFPDVPNIEDPIASPLPEPVAEGGNELPKGASIPQKSDAKASDDDGQNAPEEALPETELRATVLENDEKSAMQNEAALVENLDNAFTKTEEAPREMSSNATTTNAVTEAERGNGLFPEIIAGNTPAIDVFGKNELQASDARPQLSIILYDDALTPLDRLDLDGLPDAVTIALRAGADPDKLAVRSQELAALGYELAISFAALEEEAPRVTARRYSNALTGVPRAVGVVEDAKAGLAPNEAFMPSFIEDLKARGLGLVVQPRGLRALSEFAKQEGVLVGVVYRDIDDNAQSSRVVRRFLDGAAFVARRKGSVMIYGRLRAETVRAIAEWSVSERAQSIAFTPVSSILDGS